jgi:1,4-dihydroxy-2-naphthoate octaprenyltransferase
MKPFTIWITAARPKTLVASIAPVMIAGSLAHYDGVFHFLAFFLALVSAVCIQIATNFINDYYDNLKGGDTSERKGPTRVVQAGLATPAEMKKAIGAVVLIAVACGSYLVARGGLPIVIVGLVSITLAFLYTAGPYSLAYLGIADFFVLTFFGPIATAGTYYVQALRYSFESVVAGLAAGFFSVAILTVNNLRDREEDLKTSKRTIVVRLGKTFGQWEYTTCLLAPSIIAVWFYFRGLYHPMILLSGSIPILGSRVLLKTIWNDSHGSPLNKTLAQTGALYLVFSLLFVWGILIS